MSATKDQEPMQCDACGIVSRAVKEGGWCPRTKDGRKCWGRMRVRPKVIDGDWRKDPSLKFKRRKGARRKVKR